MISQEETVDETDFMRSAVILGDSSSRCSSNFCPANVDGSVDLVQMVPAKAQRSGDQRLRSRCEFSKDPTRSDSEPSSQKTQRLVSNT